jgi:hypothetical protein
MKASVIRSGHSNRLWLGADAAHALVILPSITCSGAWFNSITG